jgi:uncharacterized protein YgiM (DUF1202 family)
MTRMFRTLLCTLLPLSPLCAYAATQATTKANVNLRAEASRTSAKVAILEKGTTVTVLNPRATTGFYQVQTSANQQGWVSARYLSMANAGSIKNNAGSMKKTSRALARKPVNTEAEPHAIGMAAARACVSDLSACTPIGCAAAGTPHALINQLKQTVPSGTTPTMLTFDDFASLQQQADSSVGEDQDLTADDRAKLKGMTVAAGTVSEGDVVAIAGYLVDTPHPNTGESVNCNLKGAPNNDFHIPISNDPSNNGFQGIVVEMIPQSRPAEWSIENLSSVESQSHLVLVTGALLYDNLHKVNGDAGNPLSGQPHRFSLFEVHPIIGFVVCTKADNSCDPAQPSDWTPLAGQ